VGECSFWYRPTRVVPDQRPLNGRCCCCCWLKLFHFNWDGCIDMCNLKFAVFFYNPYSKLIWVNYLIFVTFLSNVMHLAFVDVCSAYEIIKLKGYTSWAIGIMVSTLCSAILRNQRQLYTLSTNAQACWH